MARLSSRVRERRTIRPLPRWLTSPEAPRFPAVSRRSLLSAIVCFQRVERTILSVSSAFNPIADFSIDPKRRLARSGQNAASPAMPAPDSPPSEPLYHCFCFCQYPTTNIQPHVEPQTPSPDRLARKRGARFSPVRLRLARVQTLFQVIGGQDRRIADALSLPRAGRNRFDDRVRVRVVE